MSMRKAPGLRLQTSIVQDNIPVEVAAGLFVGSIHAAFNVEALKSSKISHVLNLAGSYATFPEDFTYLSLSIRDKEYASLLSCLPIAAVFIDAGLKSGGVLVHCAGGRSRSPAVAMAFLMMKQQMPYAAVAAHVKTLRPVVSLNVGFDAQLKCLETARGDVFVANQHLLKARLARLAQQHEDGELEVARKRRQSQQASPPPPLLKKKSSIEMLASGCDDRGMVGERVPSGFCLSMPTASVCSKATSGKTPAASFIPALRSMGTMFGCQCCGESLFCAGAIVHHHDADSPGDGDSTRFLGTLRGQPVPSSTDNAASGFPVGEEQVAVADITKKPLLAKLRLRPQRPSVTIGNGSRTSASLDASPTRRKSASPVLLKPNLDSESSQKDDEESGPGMLQPLHILQPARRPTTEEGKRTCSAALSPSKTSGECKKKSGGGLWRSLTSFKTSKGTAKAAAEHKKNHGQLQSRSGTPELQKPTVPSLSLSEDANSSEVGQTPAHLVFLKRNAAEWHRSIQLLGDISERNSSPVCGGSTVDQVEALLDEDSTVLVALNGCKQWFIDPQLWTVGQASARPEGEIRCPREACGAIVGEWRWEGLRYACGGSIAPAFVMKKDAVCVLGNMTSQSTELMAIASSEIYPEE
ncbi:hypothetical protein PHYPSEUDO_015150 [Phytophthora pseudosyringae]|uniref:protein-tyrosine-phosphatase n=1 Tax=Phytophthora pseudosyringae TaxID=221518 RepID=A0A8T1W3T5_9STRA|nr:hypothetical protein PHYPSEUDO_015150 [Phytophthora pseudosyringae]